MMTEERREEIAAMAEKAPHQWGQAMTDLLHEVAELRTKAETAETVNAQIAELVKANTGIGAALCEAQWRVEALTTQLAHHSIARQEGESLISYVERLRRISEALAEAVRSAERTILMVGRTP